MKKQRPPYGAPPVWLPDWRDESAYRHDDYTLRFWGWEFLRRNPEYQADYAHFVSVPGSIHCDGISVNSPKWQSTTYGEWMDTMFFHCAPPALAGETVGEYQQRLEGQKYEIRHFETYYLEKWGVSCLNDPKGGNIALGPINDTVPGYDGLKMPPLFLDFESEQDIKSGRLSPPHIVTARRVTLSCEPDCPTDNSAHFFVRFDARFPLDRQWEDVRRYYNSRERCLKEVLFQDESINPPSPTREKFSTMLRVFDAVWNKVPHKEIATHIFPRIEFDPARGVNKNLITTPLEKAKRYVEGEYRKLIFWGHPM